MFLITGSLLFSSNGQANAQTADSDKQSIQMLTEFYTAYSALGISAADNKRYYVLISKYCTTKLKKEAKEFHDDEYGTDILTDQDGIDKTSAKTLKVVKDAKKQNTYIVSYFATVYPASKGGEGVNMKLALSVNVVKENGAFRIAKVTTITHY